MDTTVVETLKDIKGKLKNHAYYNEEHTRINVVLRLLMDLGWNIWDPSFVYLEYPVAREEESTKVDIALFINKRTAMFIEVKAHKKLVTDITNVERQLRNYNRDNTAEITIATDGQNWRLYYSQTDGKFADKLFHELDLLKDKEDDIHLWLDSFLSFEEIRSGNALKTAKEFLERERRQKYLQDCFPDAKELTITDPRLSVFHAMCQKLKERNVEIPEDEIIEFLKSPQIKPVSSEELRVTDDTVHDTSVSSVSAGHTKTHYDCSLPPDGTKCKIEMKGKSYTGVVVNNKKIKIDGQSDQYSLSGASEKLYGGPHNGWREWEFFINGKWILAESWRENRKR